MTTRRFRVLSLIGLTAVSLQLAGCGHDNGSGFQGYVEGEYLYLAAPQAGYLKTLDAPRGSRVARNRPAFTIAADPDDKALAEAEARAGSAGEKLQNLKQPRRPTEIAALEANLHAAQAAQRLAQIQLQQQEALQRQHSSSPGPDSTRPAPPMTRRRRKSRRRSSRSPPTV